MTLRGLPFRRDEGESSDSVRETRERCATRAATANGGSRGMTTLQTLVLFGCLALTVTAIGVAIVGGVQTQPYTEFAVLSHEDGRLVADGYPSLDADDGTVVLAVSNHEGEQMDYTIVARAEQVRFQDNRTDPVVYETTEVGRIPLKVRSNSNSYSRFDVTESPDGDHVRLVFLLYRGVALENPNRESAYHDLHIWVNGSAPSE